MMFHIFFPFSFFLSFFLTFRRCLFIERNIMQIRFPCKLEWNIYLEIWAYFPVILLNRELVLRWTCTPFWNLSHGPYWGQIHQGTCYSEREQLHVSHIWHDSKWEVRKSQEMTWEYWHYRIWSHKARGFYNLYQKRVYIYTFWSGQVLKDEYG